MQDENIPGMIFIGPPGCAKSAIAKASGSVAGAEVIKIDTGAMTGSLVGESQDKIRKAMQTFKAVSQGKGLFIATCNKIASLPPELRRRFKLGTFFFDLPDAKERDAIWKIWMAKYGFDIETELRPVDDGWTGAEIQAACEIAWRMKSNLIKAGKFIVPVSVSAGDQIAALRTMADGKFISASKPGIYKNKSAGTPGEGRKFKVEQSTTVSEIKEEQE
jgi:SpoVK/Ycf46/Vps4 family AAA+-type ATPase